jgi:hypothetical protein
MKRSEVLIVEISGKRAGDKTARPTEYVQTKYDKVIISNNHEGYETDWKIVKVPQDYEDWYRAKIALSTFWQATMNRSYAIKYAREHGYKYCVQLDDNIQSLQIGFEVACEGGFISRRFLKSQNTKKCDMFDDFVAILIEGLRRSNAGMSGMNLASVPVSDSICRERFAYSFFALDLSRIPDTFHGNFEDDFEFRLRLAQMGTPVIQFPILAYSKVPARATGDVSGCRKAYKDVGLGRGENMRHLYGDVYSCGYGGKVSSTSKCKSGEFKHKLKPFKIGVMTKDWWRVKNKIRALFRKNAMNVTPTAKIKEDK